MTSRLDGAGVKNSNSCCCSKINFNPTMIKITGTLANKSPSTIRLGDFLTTTRVVTKQSIESFAKCTGDFNPIHLDEEYARKSRFGRCIAHGMLSATLFPSLFATGIPGSVYLSQSLKFTAPVFVDDEVCATVTVTKIGRNGKLVECETICKVLDKVVISGTASIMLTEDGSKL